jgi:type IV pilus assembly protein PilO
MTETRKWTVGTALVAVVVLLAAWFLLISPKRAEVADLEAQTAAQQQENSKLQTEKEVLQQQNKNLPEMQADLAALKTKIPDAPELPTYIRELQDLGRQSGVTFTTLTPSAAVTVGGAAPAAPGGATLTPDQLAAINVTVEVSGDYFAITKFMNGLETASRYTLVSGYSITEAEAATEDAADTGSTTVATGPASLTASIDARIYMVPPPGEAVVESSTPPAPAP